eukprot:3172017-Prymnesium_polylepis.2
MKSARCDATLRPRRFHAAAVARASPARLGSAGDRVAARARARCALQSESEPPRCVLSLTAAAGGVHITVVDDQRQRLGKVRVRLVDEGEVRGGRVARRRVKGAQTEHNGRLSRHVPLEARRVEVEVGHARDHHAQRILLAAPVAAARPQPRRAPDAGRLAARCRRAAACLGDLERGPRDLA